MSLREAAPAKINLALAVTGRRPDGYHLIDTLVVFGEVGDILSAAPASDFMLALDGPFAGALSGRDDNLVLAAARRLAEATGTGHGAALTLTKALPVAAGLGGGSADAAATLRLLNRLWGLGLDAETLARIGRGLGADVAMCVHARALHAGGIGDEVAPLGDIPMLPLVLVNAGGALSTPDVYAGRSGPFSAPLGPPPDLSRFDALVEWLARHGNDLEAPARALLPAIDDVLARLADQDGCRLARMSGSGATCVGLFLDDGTAQAAAAGIAAENPGWWVVATRAR